MRRSISREPRSWWTADFARPSAAEARLVTETEELKARPRGALRDLVRSFARWSELAGQLRSVAFLPAGFDEKQAYDRSFVPGC